MSISLPTVAIDNLRIPLRNTAAAILNPASVQPRSILAQFDWILDYAASSAKPDINVLCNLQGGPGGAQQQIDIVRSVKIDNLGNPFPVYVYFLDTTDTIVAPANTMVWEPVVTNAKIANVILRGATTGTAGKTKVYFCNFFVPPYVNAEIEQAVALYKGSTAIQRQDILLPGYGAPALGDQITSQFLVFDNVSTPIPATVTVLPAQTSGFYYITAFSVFLSLGIISWPASNRTANLNCFFFDASTLATIIPIEVSGLCAGGDVQDFLQNQLIFQIENLNLRLDARRNYRFQATSLVANTGAISAYNFRMLITAAFSHNPS